jgi:DNA-binding YbaB/EbfC family protein
MMNKAGMAGLLKQAQKMKKEMERVQEEMANIRVEGSAGGGMVTVTANAALELLEIKIDPEVVDPKDTEMLEDLVLAAVNQALETARNRAQEEMAKVTGGLMPDMNLPGF